MAKPRWDRTVLDYVDAPDVEAFVEELLAVCRKHNMALGYEDTEGGFTVARGFSEEVAERLSDASIDEKAR